MEQGSEELCGKAHVFDVGQVVGIGQISLDRVWRFDGPPPGPGAAEPAGLPEYSGGQMATAMLAPPSP